MDFVGTYLVYIVPHAHTRRWLLGVNWMSEIPNILYKGDIDFSQISSIDMCECFEKLLSISRCKANIPISCLQRAGWHKSDWLVFCLQSTVDFINYLCLLNFKNYLLCCRCVLSDCVIRPLMSLLAAVEAYRLCE